MVVQCDSRRRHKAYVCAAVVAVFCVSHRAIAAEPFTEEAVQRALVYQTAAGDSWGRGVAFADLDADGDADIVAVGRSDGLVGLYENDGTGNFIDRSSGSGIPLIPAASALVVGDYDGDGDLDIYFSNWRVPNVLMRNDGNFRFADVTLAAGVGDDGPGLGCTWGDFNGDTWLDLYVANRSLKPTSDPAYIPNRLYRNNGDGTFTEVAGALGVDVFSVDKLTLESLFFDFDNDGDADLYLSTDKGAFTERRNRLFENTGGTFTDISDASGAGVSIDSMGVAVGDMDGNGYQDLYCTNSPFGNPLLMNQGNGTFVESSAAAGVESFRLGWGAAFFDFDNDTHLDLYVCLQYASNHFFDCDDVWPCVDIGPALGVDDPGNSYSIAVADIDDDGDVDFLVQNDDALLKLYINHEGELRNWIKFNVAGQEHNVFAVGAQVHVRVGSVWQMREILAGANGWKGQNELTAHFGLGDAPVVDEVVVTWPGGATQTLTNLAANRTWQIDPPVSATVPAATGACGAGMGVLLLVIGTVVIMVGRGLRFAVVVGGRAGGGSASKSCSGPH